MSGWKILKFLVLLIVAVIVALVVVVLTTDFETRRAWLEEQMTLALGREVTISGPIHLSFSLTPELVFENVKIANDQRGQDEYLLEIGHLEAGLDLIPLLTGDLRIEYFTADNSIFYLESYPEGGGNWQFGEGRLHDNAVSTPSPSPDDADQSQSMQVGITPTRVQEFPELHSLALTNSVIRWRQANGEVIDITTESFFFRMNTTRAAYEMDFVGAVNQIPAELSLEFAYDSADVDNRLLGELFSTSKAFSLTAQSGEAFFQTEGFVDNLSNLQRLEFYDAELSIPDPARFFAQFDQDIRPNGEEYAEISANFDLNYIDQMINIPNFVMAIGESDISGELHYDLTTSLPYLTGAITVNRINLDSFSAQQPQESPLTEAEQSSQPQPDSSPPQTPSHSPSQHQQNFDLSALQAMNLDLQLTIGQLIDQNSTYILQDIVADAQLESSVLELGIWQASLWDGDFSGVITAAMADEGLEIRTDLRLQDFALEQMRPDSHVRGRGTADLTLMSAGTNMAELEQNLSGEFALHSGPTIIAPPQMGVSAQQALDILIPANESSAEINLRCTATRGEIIEGTAYIDPLLLDHEDFMIGGKGIVDIFNRNIDFALRSALRRPLTSRQADEALPYEFLPLVRIYGPWDDLRFAPDMQTAIREELARLRGTTLAESDVPIYDTLLVTEESGNPCVTALSTGENIAPSRPSLFENLEERTQELGRNLQNRLRNAEEHLGALGEEVDAAMQEIGAEMGDVLQQTEQELEKTFEDLNNRLHNLFD